MQPHSSDRPYNNPRIDEGDPNPRADRGSVAADPVKVVWIGSMFLLGTVGSAVFFSWGGVLLFLLTTAFTLCFGHSLGSHRLLIHRSYEAPRWFEYLLVHFGVLVGLSGPMALMEAHDVRDWAQRQRRCHDFFSHGQPWYRDLWWQIFCRIELVRAPSFRVESRIANDRLYRFMERHWILQQAPWALLFFAIGGLSWVCWGIASRVLVSVLGHWLVGRFAHRVGERDWHVEGAAVQGHNVPWTALLTMGENWHNNHHAFPGSARLGLERGQWDPGWWVLRALSKFGLAKTLCCRPICRAGRNWCAI
ncbi:MAG: acyl-CoA desaturase, partial [Pseudomonadota bacterium]